MSECGKEFRKFIKMYTFSVPKSKNDNLLLQYQNQERIFLLKEISNT
jgi:hypothetical protein